MPTASTFDVAIAYVLHEEGPDSDRPSDKGGYTHYGIALNRHPELTREELSSWSRERCVEWYRANYWTAIAGDKLSGPLAFVLFDMAVNQGVGAAAKTLQRAVGIPEAQCDGKIGPRTLAAIGDRNWRELLVEIQALRAWRYGHDSTFEANGIGWFRRLMRTDQTALALAAFA